MEKIIILTQIINEILVANNSASIEKLTPEMNLRDDIGLDSLDLAELTVKIEDKFGVDVFEDGLINTLGEVLNKIEN